MQLAVSDRKGAITGIGKLLHLPVIGPLIGHRFIKFGVVGFCGTVVNLLALYLNQEILFKDLQPAEMRLGLSLTGAIALATIHNFLWNRSWTWGDRKGRTRYGFFIQLGQYFLACGLSIGLQFGFTLLLSQFVHYLFANSMAILLASVINYLLNDKWTFSIGNYRLNARKRESSSPR